MTEKILKHELYKHGSYLHSLKESGSSFVNIDDEIKKLEELFQLASKKDQPAAFTSEDAMWEYKYNELKALYEQMCQANEDLIQKNNKLKVDHQPTFEVGEYYKCSDIIYRVTSVGGSQIKYAKFYSEANKFYSESSASLNSNFCDNSKPATVEEVAEFERAEIKNDIDFIIKDGDGDWIEIVENIEDYFQTAEELREVEKNEN